MLAGTVIAQDTFQRANVASGWGTATDSNVWSQSQGAAGDLNVTSNEGISNASNWDQLTLGSTKAADVEILVRFSTQNYNGCGPIARYTNSTNFIHFRTISGGSQILFRVQISGTNHDYGTVSYSFTSGTYYWMRARVQDAHLYMKVWADGAAEPGAWTTTATMTSGSGLISAAGNVGMMVNDTNAKIDHFTATFQPPFRSFIDAAPRLLQFAEMAGAQTGSTVNGAATLDAVFSATATPAVTAPATLDAAFDATASPALASSATLDETFSASATGERVAQGAATLDAVFSAQAQPAISASATLDGSFSASAAPALAASATLDALFVGSAAPAVSAPATLDETFSASAQPALASSATLDALFASDAYPAMAAVAILDAIFSAVANGQAGQAGPLKTPRGTIGAGQMPGGTLTPGLHPGGTLAPGTHPGGTITSGQNPAGTLGNGQAPSGTIEES